MASVSKDWCNSIPVERKTAAIQGFLKDFHDPNTLPTRYCVVCYQQKALVDLKECHWQKFQFDSGKDQFLMKEIFRCHQCFPRTENSTVSICQPCEKSFIEGKSPDACSVNNAYIGCEHRYPPELDQLSPIEEKLIALNTAYGYVARFAVDRKTYRGVEYRKHVKGHITVFLNDVQGLSTRILPHPLL